MVRKKAEQFEEALKSLEKIVEKLERGDLPLDDSLAAFTEGIRLVQFCHKKLEEAESKVQMLLKNEQGEWAETPFDDAAAAESNDDRAGG